MRWAFILAIIATCDGFILGEKLDCAVLVVSLCSRCAVHLSDSRTVQMIYIRLRALSVSGGLALALAFSESQCRDNYYRDFTTTDTLVYPATMDRHLNNYSNLGFSSDNLSLYGSKSGLYMSPYGEEDRHSAYSRGTVGSARHNYYNLVL